MEIENPVVVSGVKETSVAVMGALWGRKHSITVRVPVTLVWHGSAGCYHWEKRVKGTGFSLCYFLPLHENLQLSQNKSLTNFSDISRLNE